jgi:hypothetical protein
LYVAIANAAGTPAVVIQDDPAVAMIDTWCACQGPIVPRDI